MVRAALLLAVTLALGAGATVAEDIRYISDQQYIPVRSGAGNEFRVVHRGIPTGTRLILRSVSADGLWSEITTDGGTSGWVRSQYLTADAPAKQQLEQAIQRAQEAEAQAAAIAGQLQSLHGEQDVLEEQLATGGSALETVSEELARLKQISGNAEQLDSENKRLAEEAVNLRYEVEMLEAENQRLQDKLQSEDFLNGALAVLLGVVIALVAPRLVPKRRRFSEWA